MTTIENHKENIREFMKDINEKINNDLIVERQKILGFSSSEASTELFELFLHKKELVTPGFHVNHRFFASDKRANNRFDFDFSRKEEILEKLVSQENFREKLCYGKSKERKMVEEAIKNLFELKKIIEDEINGEINV